MMEDSGLNPRLSSRKGEECLTLTIDLFSDQWQISPFSIAQLINNRHEVSSSGDWKNDSVGVKPLGGDGQVHKWQVFVCPNGRAAPGALGTIRWKADQSAPPQAAVIVEGIAYFQR